jgi:FAD/FMN-containing dehydrogenase
MATISGIVEGKQVTPEAHDYEDSRYQYAFSSFEDDNRIAPGLIVYPANKYEIALALKYAKSQGVAVAIRTGGHQYCGASSTVAPNIQLDLSRTFQNREEDLVYFEKDGNAFVRTSVSWPLADFAAFLESHKAFVPHGQYVPEFFFSCFETLSDLSGFYSYRKAWC